MINNYSSKAKDRHKDQQKTSRSLRQSIIDDYINCREDNRGYSPSECTKIRFFMEKQSNYSLPVPEMLSPTAQPLKNTK